MNTGSSIRFLAVPLLLALGCSAPGILPEAEYFAQGNQAMESEDYELAIMQFQKLMEEYPFSDHAEEAQLKIAYGQYLNGQYAEAIASFEDFQRMHPTSPNLPFAEYHLSMAYMDQMGPKDRDQSASEQAHAHFQALIERYPESPYAELAKEKLAECREALAEHELAVAEFYLHWRNPLGAEARLKYLLRHYPDTEVTAAALRRFGEHFRRRGDLVRSAQAFAALLEHYPESPQAGAAKRALATLTARDVSPPEQPLVALRETLGRPSATTKPVPTEETPSALPQQTHVDSLQPIR